MWTFLIVLCLTSVSASPNLPASFKKCSRKQSNFNQCLIKAVEDAIGQLTKPFEDVGLSSLEPLQVPALTIPPGTGPTKFEQNYKNMKVSGFTKAKVTKFDVNFDKKTIEFRCQVPETKMEFEYDVNGTILVMPLYGQGPGIITIDNMKFSFTFDLEENQKQGVKYFTITGRKLVLEPQHITYKFENLFNGDEKLGGPVNQVFNDNWKEVFYDVKAGYEDAFGEFFATMFNNVLQKVSVSELFD